MRGGVFTVTVAGEAGQGVKRSGTVISTMMNGLGRHVFQMDDYQSLIRGGHNFSVISSSVEPLYSHYLATDILICLDKRSLDIHRDELEDNGILVYNSDIIEPEIGTGVPFDSWIRELKGIPAMAGTVGVASVGSLCGFQFSFLETILKNSYTHGLGANVEISRRVYESLGADSGKYSLQIGEKKPGALFTGNEAIALGATAAGLDLYIAYPMTPSTSVLHFLAAQAQKLGIVVVHPENEIAVINMALGSAYAGARTMVGTSGGGFALMHEAFSLAGMSETPLLVFLASRPGPSTGVPTYTAQGDLEFALNVGHGEFARIVASPSCADEAFALTAEMLNLVWKFQVPGILLSEKHMGESTMTSNFDPKDVEVAGPVIHEGPPEDYERYKSTKSGISPMLFPPVSGAAVKSNSYEHDERGITTEDPDGIAAMHEKRHRKRVAIREELNNVRTVETYGDGANVVITYGSTAYSAREAAKNMDDVRVVQAIYLRPFPAEKVQEAVSGSDIIVAELSVSGQFEKLLRGNGFDVAAHVRQYNGRPFDPPELVRRIKEVIA